MSTAVDINALNFRAATAADLPFIIGLIADDDVSGEVADDPGEHAGPHYQAAFAAVQNDPNQLMLIAELGGVRVGTFQLTFIPSIARRGMTRALVEAVHVAPEYRNRGVGSAMMHWAMQKSRERGAGLVQLTSNKKRLDAHRFYRRLGFSQSHEGFRIFL